MVIELSGVQFGLKSYAWFQNRASTQREFDLKSRVCFQPKIARHKVQLPLNYIHFEIAQIQDLVRKVGMVSFELGEELTEIFFRHVWVSGSVVEHRSANQKVWGSIPHGNSKFFFVPRSWQDEKTSLLGLGQFKYFIDAVPGRSEIKFMSIFLGEKARVKKQKLQNLPHDTLSFIFLQFDQLL